LGTQNQLAARRFRGREDARRQPRFKIKVAIMIYSRTCGKLKGYTADLSESGIAAMLTIEVPLGELVELEFALPFGDVKTYAIVRQRNAFRFGFQFVNSKSESEVIRSTCRQLALVQTLDEP
jgi:hypothetical protein